MPALSPRLPRRLWPALALHLIHLTARAATGLVEIPPVDGQHHGIVVFYPAGAASGPPVQRWQFSLPLVADAPPVRGNGALVLLSHGSPSAPWANAGVATALAEAGYIVAAPWHWRDNAVESPDAGPVSWQRRPQEMSTALDVLAQDPRFAPLFDARRVGAFGGSAGGHTVLTLAGGRWSPAVLRAHCLANLADDFTACAGPGFQLTGGWLDGLKLAVARWVIGWKLDDAVWRQHTDPRVAAVVAAVPFAADFDLDSLASPPVPVGLVNASRDLWLVPRFHGQAVAAACGRCERLADLAEGGHGALLSPLPQRDGPLARLVNDPPGFDRARAVPMWTARVVDFFNRHLLQATPAAVSAAN